MGGYGAVDDRPKGAVIAGAAVGVLLLVLAVVGVIYYQASERRRLDALDYDTLNAEHDALKAAAAPLTRLGELATPETPPADYAAALAEARTAYERYSSPPRRQTPLPSKRPWPGQFAAADASLKSSIDHFGMVAIYLDQKSKIKPSKVSGTTNVDSDIANVAKMSTDPLATLQGAIADMQAQRDAHAWQYGPVKPTTP